MSENCRQSRLCIVINDKSQDSTAKHLSCDRLLHYRFIIHLAGERFLSKYVRNYVIGKVTGKMVACVLCHIRLTLLSSKMQNSPDK